MHPKSLQSAYHDFLQTTEVPGEIRAELSQIQDRVSDQLPRPVVGDIPPPVIVNNRDAAQLGSTRAEVFLIAGFSNRVDVLVFRKEQHILQPPGSA
jgi:hypothetical protein